MYRALLLLCVVLIFHNSHAMIRMFDGSDPASKLAPGANLHYWSAMFSANDTPAGNMDPFVSVDLLFTREDQTDEEGFIDVLVYPHSLFNHVGYYSSPDARVEYCCTKELYDKLDSPCQGQTVGHLIYNPDNNLHFTSVTFIKNESAALLQPIPVLLTDVYNVLVVNCKGNLAGSVSFSGNLVWKNPFGYLPGDLYARLPFSGGLALVYLVGFFMYLFLCLKYRKILMTLQWGILGVIGFVLVETGSWYFYRLGINNTGLYSTTGLLLVVFFSNIKHTVVRVLILLVSMGLGVVKWTLGTARIKIGVLAAFYMFFSFLFQTVKEIQSVAEKELVSSWVTFFVVLPEAILDTGFYYWIFLSLIRTMQQLTLRHQTLKLEMYKHLFVILVGTGILSAISLIYQLYLRIANKEIPWRYEWLSDSYFDLLFLGVLLGVAILWRPRENNTRYGYGEFFQEEDVNNEGENDSDNVHQIPMDPVIVGSGELTKRKRPSSVSSSNSSSKNNYDSDRERNLEKAKLKPTEFDKDILSIELSEDGDDGELGIEAQLRKMD